MWETIEITTSRFTKTPIIASLVNGLLTVTAKIKIKNESAETQKKKPADKLRSWNVRTMTTSIDINIYNTADARKTAIVNNALLCLKVGVAALQENHLTGQGSIRVNDFTFFWHGKSFDERREHGVSFAVKNTLLQHLKLDVTATKSLFVYTP